MSKSLSTELFQLVRTAQSLIRAGVTSDHSWSVSRFFLESNKVEIRFHPIRSISTQSANWAKHNTTPTIDAVQGSSAENGLVSDSTATTTQTDPLHPFWLRSGGGYGVFFFLQGISPWRDIKHRWKPLLGISSRNFFRFKKNYLKCTLPKIKRNERRIQKLYETTGSQSLDFVSTWLGKNRDAIIKFTKVAK